MSKVLTRSAWKRGLSPIRLPSFRRQPAKRRTLDAYRAVTEDFTHFAETVEEHARRVALEDLLCGLAEEFDGHPDYREEWRP